MTNLPPSKDCQFCGTTPAQRDLLIGRRATICRACVQRALSVTVASEAEEAIDRTLPNGDAYCTLCGKESPLRSTYVGDSLDGDNARVCVRCLSFAYSFFSGLTEVDRRRRIWFSDDREPTIAKLLQAHFGDLLPERVVTSSRTFPAYLRVDLQRTLDRLLDDEGARCVGMQGQYGYETLSFSRLTEGVRDTVYVAPLRHEDVDIGEAEPVSCKHQALWLVEDDNTPHAVVLSPAQEHGRRLGWHVEVAVPVGPAGAARARTYFRALEDNIELAASYRGKVLSLECQARYDGTSAGNLVVHRLPPVSRDQVILPETTLALLERNVFRFFAQRDRLASLNMSIKKGLLLYGPPGTGKTHTIRYLAGALPDHTTLLVTAEQVSIIAEYMSLARLLSPSMLVIEDVDLIAREREGMTPRQESLLNRLLNEMDGLQRDAEVLFILTTNHPTSLEAALAGRPGRVDQAIEFPLPDAPGRHKLLELYRHGLNVGPEVRDRVVERTDGVAASFIKELMRRVAQFCIERSEGGTHAAIEDVDRAIGEMLFEGGTLNASLLGAGSPTQSS